jgi:membrane protease YdiL (CAAX protease family)
MEEPAAGAFQPQPHAGPGPAGPATQLQALLLGPGLIYGLMIWWSLQGFQAPEPQASSAQWLSRYLYGIFVYFGLGGGLLTLLLYCLCRQRFADLQIKAGTWLSDLAHGAALLLLNLYLIDPLYNFWVPLIASYGLETSNLEQMTSAETQSPLLQFVALGPYNWLAAAFFEELLRVFMLTRLWLLSGTTAMALFSIALASVLFGLCHIYQGLSGIIHAALFGLVASVYYWRYRRFWPLVLCHGVYGMIALLSWYAWTAAQTGR